MKSKNTDKRLIKAYEAIDSGKIEVLSLDIFDTLLWRKIAVPSDLFFILGRRLKSEGWLIPSVTPESFYELRMMAESLARMEGKYRKDNAEICLKEIYWKMTGIFVKISVTEMLDGTVKGIFESDVSELVNIEVALEKEFICFDTNIIHLIFYAKHHNIPVILVSDTYFEESHILNFFDQPSFQYSESFLSCIQKLFISNEYGCGKENGLFKRVLEEFNIEPSKLLHIGDNRKADLLAASKEGITTHFYPKFDKYFSEAFNLEGPKNTMQRNQLIDTNQGDFGISALRSKINYHVALNDIEKKDQFFWKYGAMILGPILWGFVYWIYDSCYQMQQHEVFCLMREGKLYAKLIDHFAPYYPKHTLKTHPLWVSRAFIHHASISMANVFELSSSMSALVEHFTLEEYCNYLGIDIQKMHKWSKYKHIMLEGSLIKKEFINYLLLNKSLCEKIIENAKAKRDRFFKYLSGLVDLSHCAQMTLVDVGWGGTAQRLMQNMLRQEGFSTQLNGLYLGTSTSTYPSLLKGEIMEGYLIKGGFTFGGAYIKGCFVLEQTATAETGMGSLQDIDEEGRIITSPSKISYKQKIQAELVQQGILAFFDLIGPYVQSGFIKWDSKSEMLHNQLLSQLLRSMFNPTKTEAQKFGAWYHEHGPTDLLTQSIGNDHYYNRFIKDMLPEMADKGSGLNWPAAYAAKHSQHLAMMSEKVLLKQIPPECFLSTDNFILNVSFETENGFSKNNSKNINLHSNSNRAFYTAFKISSFKKPIKKLQLKLYFPSAIVRIKSLRLVVYNKSTANPKLFTYFESEKESNRLECIAEKQFDYNTFYCDKDLNVVETFDSPDVYLIKVNLCCEMIKWNKTSVSPMSSK